MNKIYDIGKDKTLLIVAHKLSIIEKCQKVYEINNNKLEERK